MTAAPRARLRTLVALALTVFAVLLASASPALAATFTVVNTANEGPGSLRAAIEEANLAGAGNTIRFEIPGAGPFTIKPATALPTIIAANTTIDACTQAGADCSGLPLNLEIRLDGQGFALVGNGITIRGFSFTGPGTGISLSRVAEAGVFRLEQNVTIEDNYLGLAPDGSADGKEPALNLQPGLRNIKVANGLHILDNVIGANNVGPGAKAAIDLSSFTFGAPAPMTGLQIEGNIIGLDPTGTQPRPNAGGGIVIEESADARIVGNTIADNAGAGIIHSGRTQATPHTDPALEPGLLIADNIVEGNEKEGIAIGPDRNGPGASQEAFSGPATIFGNTVRSNGSGGSFAGIAITEAADTQHPNVQIGGLEPGQANLISGNTGAGVEIGPSPTDTSVGVTVRGNSIFANAGLPIDLGDDGPTANAAAGASSTGPNSLVDHPVISAIGHGSVVVDGTYARPPSASFTLDFYKSETETGPQMWIGSVPVTTDAAGEASFHAEFEPDVPAGWFITATATDAVGSTSEFVTPVVVPARPSPPGGGVTVGGTPGGNPAPGPASSPPQPPQQTKNHRHTHQHGHKAMRGKPRLVLKQTASSGRARPSSVVGYTITIANRGTAAARGVKVCVRPSPGLTILRTEPAATGDGTICWHLRSLAAGGRRTFRVTAQVAPLLSAALVRNVATVTAANTKAVRTAVAHVRVKPLPKTACGSAAAGIGARC